MLALETGWTPEVIGSVPDGFRRALHWALFVRAIVGDEGLPSTELPRGAPVEARTAAAKLAVSVAKTRTLIYPEEN